MGLVGGPSTVGSNFSKWCDPRLCQFVQDHINAIYNGHATHGAINCGQICLRPSYMQVDGMLLLAKCTLIFPDFEEFDTEHYEIEIQLKRLQRRQDQFGVQLAWRSESDIASDGLSAQDNRQVQRARMTL